MENKVVFYEGFNDNLANVGLTVKVDIENAISNGISLSNSYTIDSQKDSKMRFFDLNDKYTIVYVYMNDYYVYIYCNKKSEAHIWASNKICDVNSVTGNVQLYVVGEPIKKVADNKLFEMYTDKQLVKIGVPGIQLDLVRSLSTFSDLEQIKSRLDKSVYFLLRQLAVGNDYDEIFNYVSSIPSNGNCFENPMSKNSFHVLENEVELHQIITEPLDKWRVYLHPTQRSYAESDYNGPVKITGEAGTGKTVVALHRAKKLFNEGKNVLFTTYTTNLIKDIEYNLSKIINYGSRQKIKVTNVDSYVAEFIRLNHLPIRLVYDDNIINEYWDKAIKKANVSLDFDCDFYKREWKNIYTFLEEMDLASYSIANRPGSGLLLRRSDRREVAKVFDEYIKILNENDVKDIDYALHECCLFLKTQKKYYFDSVIVDELQDMSRNQLKFLRLLVDEKENDMFLVGDSRQRIYNSKVNIRDSGIDTKNRSYMLNVNYRTTEEISKVAKKVLGCVEIDDLDGNEYEKVADATTLINGGLPVIKNFDTFGEQMRYVYSELKQETKTNPNLQDFCIVARTNDEVSKIESYLDSQNISSVRISTDKYDDPSSSKIKIATMHRIKGLEFKYVFICSLNDNLINYPANIDEKVEFLNFEREHSLLYVAMTRAQRKVYLLSYGKTASVLDNIFLQESMASEKIVIPEELSKFDDLEYFKEKMDTSKTVKEFTEGFKDKSWQDILKPYLKKQNIRYADIATWLVLTPYTIKKIMAGEVKVSKEYLIEIAFNLGLGLDELTELLAIAVFSL